MGHIQVLELGPVCFECPVLSDVLKAELLRRCARRIPAIEHIPFLSRHRWIVYIFSIRDLNRLDLAAAVAVEGHIPEIDVCSCVNRILRRCRGRHIVGRGADLPAILADPLHELVFLCIRRRC